MTRCARAICATVWLAVPVSAWPAETASRTCVDVKIGSAESYACLSEEFARLIPAHRLSSLDTPYRADSSPAPATGVYDRAATAETLGNAFGHSAIPQRPPPAVYPSLLGIPLQSRR